MLRLPHYFLMLLIVSTVVITPSISYAELRDAVENTVEAPVKGTQSVIHHGPLGLVARLVVIPLKIVEYALTGVRGIEGLHNVMTRPYEGP